MIQKPKIGEQCNGCGVCCKISMCNTGAFLLGKVKVFGEKRIYGECEALVKKVDGGFGCGLIIKPGSFIKSKYRDDVVAKNVAILVGAGTGCDEIGEDEGNEIEEQKLDRMIEQTVNDSEWRSNATKALEMIIKIKNNGN